MVGKAMASNEDDAYTIMQDLGVDYVLIIFGGLLGKLLFKSLVKNSTIRIFGWWYQQVSMDGANRRR